MGKKYYAVRIGRHPGIYDSWEECEKTIKGFPNADFKGFNTIAGAEEYLHPTIPLKSNIQKISKPPVYEMPKRKSHTEIMDVERPYAFVDGSFNVKTKVYGYGGFLYEKSNKHIIQGSGNDEDFVELRNIAGEICGAMAAVKMAHRLNLSSLDIYYDYNGIEKWATGEWDAKKEGPALYRAYMREVMRDMEIRFFKVKSHSGNPDNNEADRLAKNAVGLR